ncbi:MAG: ketopantoate reductase family protein [Candidatus Ventricola sp.]
MDTVETIGLIGLGAVGALYAERLMHTGARLCVIVDEARRERYARDGVFVNGTRVDFPYVTPEDAQPVDLLIIATKAGGLESAMETAAGFVGPDTLMLTLINGVTSEETLASRFGAANVLYAVAQGMDAVKEGNRLTYTHPGMIVLGEREPGPVSARVQAVADCLNAHGVKVVPVEDMVRRQWGKLMLNVGINQAVMVFEGDYGTVQRPGRPREVMLGAMREAQQIAALEGHPIPDTEFDEWVALADSLAPEGKPSMRQDGEAHRPSEVELFAGTMVRLGRRHGVPTPVNDWLYARVQELEAAY